MAGQLFRFPEECRKHELVLRRLDPTCSTTGGKLLRLYNSGELDWPPLELFRAETDPLVRFHGWWNLAVDEHNQGNLPAAWSAYQSAWPDCPPDWKPVMVRTLSRLSRESSALQGEIQGFLPSRAGA